MTKALSPRPVRANPINVMAKAGAILNALEAAGELTPTELAERVGEPRSSIYRLIESLDDLGFVSAGTKRGHIRLGMNLYRLGTSALRSRDLRTVALPHMVDVRNATGATVFLAIRQGEEALCIERIDGLALVNNTLLPGRTGPLHVGAVGKVLLAAESDGFIESLAARGLIGFTAHTKATRDALLEDVKQIRRIGASISDQDRLLGMAGVGAPIRGHDEAVCAALSFSGMRPMILEENEEASIALVKQVARKISIALGSQGSLDGEYG